MIINGFKNINLSTHNWSYNNCILLSKAELEQTITAWITNPKAAQFTEKNNIPYYGNISNWDVSKITDMSYLFSYKDSWNNDDISKWDVSNVTDMSHMFNGSQLFNQDISNWDISQVKNMNNMFDNTGNLSIKNKCLIDEKFSANTNWPYDWANYCYCDESQYMTQEKSRSQSLQCENKKPLCNEDEYLVKDATYKSLIKCSSSKPNCEKGTLKIQEATHNTLVVCDTNQPKCEGNKKLNQNATYSQMAICKCDDDFRLNNVNVIVELVNIKIQITKKMNVLKIYVHVKMVRQKLVNYVQLEKSNIDVLIKIINN